MDIAETKAFMRERLFDTDVADAITIDGSTVYGHIDEKDVDIDRNIGVFVNRIEIVIPPDAIALPVPGQQLVVNGNRVTVARATSDAVSMTINAMRNSA